MHVVAVLHPSVQASSDGFDGDVIMSGAYTSHGYYSAAPAMASTNSLGDSDFIITQDLGLDHLNTPVLQVLAGVPCV